MRKPYHFILLLNIIHYKVKQHLLYAASEIPISQVGIYIGGYFILLWPKVITNSFFTPIYVSISRSDVCKLCIFYRKTVLNYISKQHNKIYAFIDRDGLYEHLTNIPLTACSNKDALYFLSFLFQQYISGWHSGSGKSQLQHKVAHDLLWPMNITK